MILRVRYGLSANEAESVATGSFPRTALSDGDTHRDVKLVNGWLDATQMSFCGFERGEGENGLCAAARLPELPVRQLHQWIWSRSKGDAPRKGGFSIVFEEREILHTFA